MNENTRLILGGLGGFLLAAVGAIGLSETQHSETPPAIIVTATPLPEQPAYTCPPGWEIPEDNRDEHGIVYACERGPWLVILEPSTGAFERAWKEGDPRWVENPQEVDGWPAR